MKYDQEFQLVTEASKSENHIVYKCKKELCRYILNLENQLLEEPLSVENILKHEVEIPDSLGISTKYYTQEKIKQKKQISKKIQTC